MRDFLMLFFHFIILACMVMKTEAMANPNSKMIDSFKQVKAQFKNPPVEYQSAPLWVWNDDVSEEKIDQQLIDLKTGGMGGVFIHPRPGLITPYLSDKWFSLCRYTVDKAKEMGMQVWLYDENSYPSGFAGGHVPAEMPESFNQGQGLRMSRATRLPQGAAQKYYLVLKEKNSKFTDITARLDQEKDKEGSYYLFEKTYYGKSAWHGGYSYVDLLVDGVTEKFIDVTMTGYEKAIGDEFGKVVPGIFTDEPNIYSPGGMKFTPDLFSEFMKRWGYDLKTVLPALFLELDDWKRIRHNYYTTLLEMFIEKWSKPWYNYCEQKNLEWTGHYWEHGWPHPGHCIDNMALYAWHQVPAIDNLMNQYSESVNSQFGNVRAVKELISVANQMGRTRTLSETYGAGGWDIRFEDMKRIGDWQYVLGVNFLNQHLSYITIAGARKRDHPQSFSYHDPWWKLYKVQGDYFARLSLALSSGKQINQILVLEPTTTAWMYFSPQKSNQKFFTLGPSFQNFVLTLEKYQIEYDLGSENIIGNNGKINNNTFVVGERSYELVVLPPDFGNLDQKTANLIEQYLQGGGKVLSIAGIPEFIDGRASDKMKSLAEKYSKQWIIANSVTESNALDLLKSEKIQFRNPEQISGILFHHRRELSDGELVFLVNTSAEEWSTGQLLMPGKFVLELNLISGETTPYTGKMVGDKVEIDFDIPPAGSLLLFADPSASSSLKSAKEKSMHFLSAAKPVKIARIAPNVLTLDYVDLKLNDQIQEDIYFFEAADKIYKHYGFEGNPWSRAVQYKSTIIDHKINQDDSGFEVTYLINIADGVDNSGIQAVVERPELWQLNVNGKVVAPNANESWLDRSFGVFNVGNHLVPGKNRVTLIGSTMTVHSEVEPIYLIGDFGLESQEKGWKIISSNPLSLGSWKGQGMPFYSDGVAYTKSYSLNPNDKRYIIKLTDWYGCVAEVTVNEKLAGIIGWSPFELDITNMVKNGENEISVIVYGTLKNQLGPHHVGPLRGSAWPASFEAASEKQPAGEDYDVIDYGLFDEFILIEHEGEPQRVYWRDYRVAKPKINPETNLIMDLPATITITTETEAADIRYTIDGTIPDRSSALYTGPIKIDKSNTIAARAFKEGLKQSQLVQQNFVFIDKNKNGLDFKYAEGIWQRVPDFDTLTVIKKGRAYNFSFDGIDRRKEQFALEYKGYIHIDQEGEYIFYLRSNDGSILRIGDEIVVDNDGNHGVEQKQGNIELTAGLHPIRVSYFDSGGSQELQVIYQGPGVKKQVIPADKLFFRGP